MKLLFSNESVGASIVECYRHQDNLETGGVLVGPKNQKGVVTDFIPSSHYAERKAATYFQSPKDVRILNRQLKKFQARGLDFKGYIHRHLFGLTNLSLGDKNTSKEILSSPNYKIDNFLIMCIIAESHTQDFPLFSYVVYLDKNKEVLIQKADICILPRICILECAECFEPQILGDSHENKSVEPDSVRTENLLPQRTIRNSGKGFNHRKLIGM